MPGTRTVKNDDLFADVEQIIGDGGHIQLRIKGYSMRPFLRNGIDSVHLSPISAGELRRGMVALFRHRNRHILHRIRRIEGNKITFRGDGNYRRSEYSSRGEVAAFADYIVRGGKTVTYGSMQWKLLSFWSLSRKAARTVYLDLRNVWHGITDGAEH